jgi:hypothetical protein
VREILLVERVAAIVPSFLSKSGELATTDSANNMLGPPRLLKQYFSYLYTLGRDVKPVECFGDASIRDAGDPNVLFRKDAAGGGVVEGVPGTIPNEE